MLAAVLAPLLVAAVAFVLRIAVHAGRTPGGVDTWYYLAYADAFRRRPSFDVRLPQYLLQDERQSYPPLFPSLLAVFPSSWLRRWYWTLSPAIDCVHLLLLYFVAFRLTASPVVATIAAATYAFTPQLISETRSLSPRPFGALLHSIAMLLLLKYTLTSGHWTWAAAAAVAAALLFLSSAALAAAYALVCTMLSVVFHDPRDVTVAASGFALAVVLSGGHMRRVVRNYVFAVEYWRRNRHLYGRHPVHDSPVLGTARPPERGGPQPGFLGETTTRQLVRLLGENPFLLALPFAPRLVASWSVHLRWWAIGLATLSVVATILPPLRAFGPGRSYMKAAIFPTAYTLASGIGTTAGLARPSGLITIACLIASIGAIAFFYMHARRRPTEQTASVPAGLRKAVQMLADLPPGGVFVLPYMYADYVCYWSGKPVVWGGHCGDHRRFEWITPVISRPLDEIFAEIGVRYILLDRQFASVGELHLTPALSTEGETDGFGMYALQQAPASDGASHTPDGASPG